MDKDFKRELFASVSAQLEKDYKDAPSGVTLTISKAAAHAAILVLEEYEKLKDR